MRRLYQLIQVDTGIDSHSLQHEHQVVHRDIAGRLGCKRTPSGPTCRSIQDVSTRTNCGIRIGKSDVPRIVQVDTYS